jgi:predicted Zn-dependent peptidase
MRIRKLAVSFIAAVAILSAQRAPQAVSKQGPPAPGPARAFSFPKFETKKLANGLTVFVVEDRRQPVISYWLAVNAGAILNDPKKAGVAEMTADMLRDGGTKTRTSQEIAKLVDSNGGSLDAGASADGTMVHGTWLKTGAALGMELLADVILNPVFDQKELERIREQALAGLQVSFTSPASLLNMAAARVVYGSSPYGYPEGGTPETMRAITRGDLVNFHKAYYVPAGAYLAITGDITPAAAFAEAEKYLGKWGGTPAAAPVLPAPPASQRRVVMIDKPDTPQSRIFVGETGIPRNNPDFIPLLFANEAYGGGFTSRLSMTLRANEGLTYSASSTMQNYRSTGAFITETSTRTEKTADALKAILEVQNDFAAHPTTASELQDAKARLVGLFQLSTETPDAVAERLIRAAVNGLPADYYKDYTERLRATTLEQVNSAEKKYFHPDKTAIVIVGNTGQFSKQLAAYGPSLTIPAADFDPVAPDLVRPKETTPAATAESKARGRELVDAAVKALGGAEALNSIKDLTSKSTLTMKSPQGEMKAEATEDILYPDKFRASLKLPFGEMVQVFDGKSFWIKQGATVRDMPPTLIPEAIRTVRSAGALGFLRDAIDGKAEVQAIGDDGVLWKEGNDTAKLYFDPQTHLVSKMVYHSAGMTGAVEVEQGLSDYRPAGPIKLPFHETLTQGGHAAGDRVYTERKVNSGLTAAEFVRP